MVASRCPSPSTSCWHSLARLIFSAFSHLAILDVFASNIFAVAVMDDTDFGTWTVFWKANLAFYRVVDKPQKCIVCDQAIQRADGLMRSTFWLDGARCSVGHRQAKKEELEAATGLGVCSTCDQIYMLDIAKGRIKCRREPCQRTVRVHHDEIMRVLRYDEQLL